jgi:hypothetical protein
MAEDIFLYPALTCEQNYLVFGMALLGCRLDNQRIVVLLPAKK